MGNAPDTSKRDYTVFIIDDDKFLLDIYSIKFKDHGCKVIAEPDPVKALQALRGGLKPDVILLDIIMPALGGFELLEAMQKEGLAKDSSIIILSNQGQDEDVKRAIDLGADGYIVKASAIPSEVLTKTIEYADKRHHR